MEVRAMAKTKAQRDAAIKAAEKLQRTIAANLAALTQARAA
jgi:hypothetical protein